ncbi:pyridoxal phosphate-dependent aminotransferase [Leuconostoc inhae]|uniref:pyridoxal phosphate-dependent aminotransferase n=1 Tax=Leuconostoc inhae TaxID=178001 RepID=UPI001C7DBDE4|nr:histidinol-phosphate transaminase [Leuconostoc inhae]
MDMMSSTFKKYNEINDFSINTNPLGVPNAVLDNAEKIIKLGHYYPDPTCFALRKELAKQYQLNSENIMCGNGANDLIYRIITALNPRKSLIITPTYEEYEKLLLMHGSEIDHYHLNINQGKDYNLDKVIKKINSDLDIMIICNPNNPTGTTFSILDLEKIISHCQKHHVYVVIDESFIAFLNNWQKITVKSMVNHFDNLIVIDGFTKFFALAGFRVGFAISSNQNLFGKMSTMGSEYNVATVSQIAARLALHDNDYVENTYHLLKKEKQFLKFELNRLPIKLIGLSANFILFYSEKDNLREDLLKLKIKTRDCSQFVGLNSYYHRVAIKTHDDNEQLILALKQVFS